MKDKSVQMMHLRRCRDELDMCKECKAIDAFTIDNIDDYAEAILERM